MASVLQQCCHRGALSALGTFPCSMKKLNFIFPQFIADLQMSPESYSDSVHCCYRTPTELQAWFLKAQCVIYQRDMLKIGHRYIRWRNILVFNSVEITAKTKAPSYSHGRCWPQCENSLSQSLPKSEYEKFISFIFFILSLCETIFILENFFHSPHLRRR